MCEEEAATVSISSAFARTDEADEGGDELRHPGRRLTEEEFVAWCGRDVRAEWVNGQVVMMAPVSFQHADLSAWLLAVVRGFIRRHDLGVAVGGEFYVRLADRRRLPDLLFLAKARLHLLRKNHVEGAPDLVVEIVSPESESRDWREKYLEYENAGVREYWVVDPMSQRVEAYALGGGRYSMIAEREGQLHSAVLPGFFLKTTWLWQVPLPAELDVLRELGV